MLQKASTLSSPSTTYTDNVRNDSFCKKVVNSVFFSPPVLTENFTISDDRISNLKPPGFHQSVDPAFYRKKVREITAKIETNLSLLKKHCLDVNMLQQYTDYCQTLTPNEDFNSESINGDKFYSTDTELTNLKVSKKRQRRVPADSEKIHECPFLGCYKAYFCKSSLKHHARRMHRDGEELKAFFGSPSVEEPKKSRRGVVLENIFKPEDIERFKKSDRLKPEELQMGKDSKIENFEYLDTGRSNFEDFCQGKHELIGVKDSEFLIRACWQRDGIDNVSTGADAQSSELHTDQHHRVGVKKEGTSRSSENLEEKFFIGDAAVENFLAREIFEKISLPGEDQSWKQFTNFQDEDYPKLSLSPNPPNPRFHSADYAYRTNHGGFFTFDHSSALNFQEVNCPEMGCRITDTLLLPSTFF
jgi:hypothetical protein